MAKFRHDTHSVENFSNTNHYPLMVFLHGGGEFGNGEDQLPLVLKNAVPNYWTINFSVNLHR
jgi:predicted peptidase